MKADETLRMEIVKHRPPAPRAVDANKLQLELLARLSQELDPAALLLDRGDSLRSRNRRIAVAKQLTAILQDLDPGGASAPRDLIPAFLDKLIDYGPLLPLLLDEEISDIMVNRADQVYVERQGKLAVTDVRFQDDQHLLQTIHRITEMIGRSVDDRRPMVDARLPDGSRVNAVIPPLAVQGPMLTIRKFSRDLITMSDLVSRECLSADMAELLRAAVLTRQNIVISGGTGAGKTTLLNVLSSFVPPHERIITIEDAAELQLSQEHVGRLEARPPGPGGEGAVEIRDLFRNSLRMRPDRIIVGECRGGEALDMLQAMNSGHDGSMTTAHANSPKDLIYRLETMVALSGMNLPLLAIRRYIAGAVNLIVQIARYPDGVRRINEIVEITGMEGDTITRSTLFQFRQTGVSGSAVVGHFQSQGVVPRFYEQVRERGIQLSLDIF
ncbi:MAG: CpaF family protein [Candidatus Schekmanbacteria bacterium]|nr:CpaF family protein [Candidatus Schekmanbacteria bacterium]